VIRSSEERQKRSKEARTNEEVKKKELGALQIEIALQIDSPPNV